MEQNITWILEGKIDKKRKKEFIALMDEMIATVTKEPQTLAYEWNIAEDGESISIYERYENEDATNKHLAEWGQFSPRYLDLIRVNKFTVFSDLSPELRETVAGLNPVYMRPIGGFSKF